MSRIFESLEKFVPLEHKDEYRKFVAYAVQFKPNDEIGQICHAAGWLAMITRETPGAFSKNAEAFLSEWKKEQTQLINAVGSFKDDQVRLSTKHEELITLIEKASGSIANLFTYSIAQTNVVIREAGVHEKAIKRACTDLKQVVDSAKADLLLATTTAMERIQKEVRGYYSAGACICLGLVLMVVGTAEIFYPDAGIYAFLFGFLTFGAGALQLYVKGSWNT